jgi:hypothetical protein
MNRQPNDILVLPHSFYDLKIKSNEFVTADNFSAALDKIDQNLNYLISQTILNNFLISYPINLISLSAIVIQEGEFTDPFTINKALSKSLYNNLTFRDNLHSRFLKYIDLYGIVQIQGTRYIVDGETNIYSYSINLNNFVGINEIVSTAVINRCLEQIYNLQVNLLDLCQSVYICGYIPPTLTYTPTTLTPTPTSTLQPPTYPPTPTTLTPTFTPTSTSTLTACNSVITVDALLDLQPFTVGITIGTSIEQTATPFNLTVIGGTVFQLTAYSFLHDIFVGWSKDGILFTQNNKMVDTADCTNHEYTAQYVPQNIETTPPTTTPPTTTPPTTTPPTTTPPTTTLPCTWCDQWSDATDADAYYWSDWGDNGPPNYICDIYPGEGHDAWDCGSLVGGHWHGSQNQYNASHVPVIAAYLTASCGMTFVTTSSNITVCNDHVITFVDVVWVH